MTVAPHAGAWIETGDMDEEWEKYKSRPMRARGLKRLFLGGSAYTFSSRPMRARGLKLFYSHHSKKKRKSRPMRARGLKLGNG